MCFADQETGDDLDCFRNFKVPRVRVGDGCQEGEHGPVFVVCCIARGAGAEVMATAEPW